MNWQTLIPSNSPKHTVKGTELARALLGPNSRFALYEVRCISSDGYPDVFYRLRDAETITNAEIREGKRPQIIAEFPTFAQFEKFYSTLSKPRNPHETHT